MDDWQVGDLALCVGRDPDGTEPCGWQPNPGGVYEVSLVDLPRFAGDFTGLDFVEDFDPSPEAFFDALYFRKIKPLTDEERDEELAQLDVDRRETAPSELEIVRG